MSVLQIENGEKQVNAEGKKRRTSNGIYTKKFVRTTKTEEDAGMAMQERPQVRETIGGKCWEHVFKDFYLKAYVPENDLPDFASKKNEKPQAR